MKPPQPSRRLILRAGLLLCVGGWSQALAGCSPPRSSPPDTGPTPTSVAPSTTPTGGATQRSGRALLAYFSRPGENYYYYGGRRDLQVGNTEVLARMIADLIDGDLYRIEASDPYPDSYDATVARNSAEQDAETRPSIAEPLTSLDGYQRVLLGSPIWSVQLPRIMTTFTETHDFTGKTVHPFVTYAVSGLGSTERDYTGLCSGAQVGRGLAVQGEEVAEHRDDVETWLREARLLSG